MADVHEEPGEEDLPPKLEWESDLWDMYWLLRNQWRVSIQGYVGLDLNVFNPIIERKGWNMTLSLALLSTIEDVMLRQDLTS